MESTHGSAVLKQRVVTIGYARGTFMQNIVQGLVYWGLTPQQQPGSYQGGEMMMMMKSVFWWRNIVQGELAWANNQLPSSITPPPPPIPTSLTI